MSQGGTTHQIKETMHDIFNPTGRAINKIDTC